MTTIHTEDLTDSIADALQFISYYHPADFIRALKGAYELEDGPAAKNAMLQLLVNSRMSAMGKRPICQDTGVAHVFVEIGMEVRFATRAGGAPPSLQAVVDSKACDGRMAATLIRCERQWCRHRWVRAAIRGTTRRGSCTWR